MSNMIDEKFLQQAVDIRRRYLKVSNNMEVYISQLKKTESELNKYLKELDGIIDESNECGRSKATAENNINRLLKILDNLREVYDNINHKMIEPNNKVIEKLVEEEKVFYDHLISTYPTLTIDTIRTEVWDRLKEDGLG